MSASASLSHRFTEWFPSALAEFETSKKLRTTVDPENTPFKSKYEAIELYERMMKDLVDSGNDQSTDRYWLVLFALNFETGVTHMDTEDLSAAERSLKQCLTILGQQLKLGMIVDQFNSNDEETKVLVDDKKGGGDSAVQQASDDIFLLLKILLYNQLAFLKCMKLNFNSSLPFLKEAEKLFYKWEKQDPPHYQLTIKDLFQIDPSVQSRQQLVEYIKTNADKLNQELYKIKMERAQINTVYYLAQAYEQTGEYSESARYCHLTLRLQHPFLDTGLFAVDHIEWALNAATLSQYFGSNDQYDVARHLMCCARIVWRQTEKKIQDEQNERWRKAGADLDRIEVKYCLMLLDESIKLLHEKKMDNYPKTEWKFMAYLLKDDEVAQLESTVPGFPVRNYDDAKLVFKYALNAITNAKQFFTLHERASDYVDCVFDHSQIFGSIIQFEPDIGNRCKMMKRRIDMLEEIGKELNPQHFLSHCRKIYYELGDLYSQQVYLKYAQQEANFARCQAEVELATQNPELIAKNKAAEIEKNYMCMLKINLLVYKSIQAHHKFLSSFETLNKDAGKGKKFTDTNINFDKLEMYPLPARIGEDASYIQPILTAYVSIGRLYLKLVSSKQEERIKNHVTCERYYQELQRYLQQNEDHRKKYFEEYLPQIEEMLRLIPGKIQNILSQSVAV